MRGYIVLTKIGIVLRRKNKKHVKKGPQLTVAPFHLINGTNMG